MRCGKEDTERERERETTSRAQQLSCTSLQPVCHLAGIAFKKTHTDTHTRTAWAESPEQDLQFAVIQQATELALAFQLWDGDTDQVRLRQLFVLSLTDAHRSLRCILRLRIVSVTEHTIIFSLAPLSLVLQVLEGSFDDVGANFTVDAQLPLAYKKSKMLQCEHSALYLGQHSRSAAVPAGMRPRHCAEVVAGFEDAAKQLGAARKV
jgi:hypothetical protein